MYLYHTKILHFYSTLVILSLHEHLITLLFCNGVVDSKSLVPFVFVLSFISNLSCLFVVCTSDLSHGYSTLDFVFLSTVKRSLSFGRNGCCQIKLIITLHLLFLVFNELNCRINKFSGHYSTI